MTGTDRQRELAPGARQLAGTLDQARSKRAELLKHARRRAFLGGAAGGSSRHHLELPQQVCANTPAKR